MNHDQATTIAKRIINTMRPTPALVEWQEVLEPLDFDAALATFRDFRERTSDGLDIAAFLAAHRRRTSANARTRPQRANDASEHCEHCHGCGFEAGPPEYQTVLGERHEYTTVVPCRCTRGEP